VRPGSAGTANKVSAINSDALAGVCVCARIRQHAKSSATALVRAARAGGLL